MSQTDQDAPSSSLLLRVRSRDPEAWSRLTAYYGPVDYGWARGFGLQESDAADLTQDVFRAVLTGIDGIGRDGRGDNFIGWLWTISRNQVRAMFRKGEPVGTGGDEARKLLE